MDPQRRKKPRLPRLSLIQAAGAGPGECACAACHLKRLMEAQAVAEMRTQAAALEFDILDRFGPEVAHGMADRFQLYLGVDQKGHKRIAGFSLREA